MIFEYKQPCKKYRFSVEKAMLNTVYKYFTTSSMEFLIEISLSESKNLKKSIPRHKLPKSIDFPLIGNQIMKNITEKCYFFGDL